MSGEQEYELLHSLGPISIVIHKSQAGCVKCHSHDWSHGSLDRVLDTSGIVHWILALQVERNVDQRHGLRRLRSVYHHLQHLSMLAGILVELLEGQGEDVDVFRSDIREVRL
jgi:hypothetical protein